MLDADARKTYPPPEDAGVPGELGVLGDADEAGVLGGEGLTVETGALGDPDPGVAGDPPLNGAAREPFPPGGRVATGVAGAELVEGAAPPGLAADAGAVPALGPLAEPAPGPGWAGRTADDESWAGVIPGRKSGDLRIDVVVGSLFAITERPPPAHPAPAIIVRTNPTLKATDRVLPLGPSLDTVPNCRMTYHP